MKSKRIAPVCIGVLGVFALANFANAQQSFTYTDPSDHNLAASFTLDVVAGQALSGSGTVTSNLWNGADNLVLLTPSTTFPISTDGQIILPPAAPAGTFGWEATPGSDGTNFGWFDNVVTSSSPYFDTNGPAFEIVNPNTNAIIGGLNIWAASAATNSAYSDAIFGAGTGYYSLVNSQGTLLPAVPEPSTYALLVAGLGLAHLAVRRRRLA